MANTDTSTPGQKVFPKADAKPTDPNFDFSGSAPKPDVMQTLLDRQQRMMNNMRSGEVRHDTGGRVIDENTPTGLDWLSGHDHTGGHSWEQRGMQTTLAPDWKEAAALKDSLTHPEHVVHSTLGTSLMSPYGGGFAQDGHYGKFNTQDIFNDKTRPTTHHGQVFGDTETNPNAPFLPHESARLTNNVNSAYNQALTAPSPFEAEHNKRATTDVANNAGNAMQSSMHSAMGLPKAVPAAPSDTSYDVSKYGSSPFAPVGSRSNPSTADIFVGAKTPVVSSSSPSSNALDNSPLALHGEIPSGFVPRFMANGRNEMGWLQDIVDKYILGKDTNQSKQKSAKEKNADIANEQKSKSDLTKTATSSTPYVSPFKVSVGSYTPAGI